MSEMKKAREIHIIAEKEAEYGTSTGCFSETNKVWLRGTIAEEASFSHKIHKQEFYKTKVATKRKSGVEDLVPIIIHEQMLEHINGLHIGQYVEIGGRLYSHYNMDKSGKSHLELAVYTKVIVMLENDVGMEDENSIFIKGTVRKPVNYRISPVSYKDITDMFLSVKREPNKLDYIPCIAWGRYAKLASFLNIGDEIKAYGRIQSRKYSKELDSGESKVVEINEVSISEFF